MKESLLEVYGVQVKATPHGVRYVLPWMKDTTRKASSKALFFGVLPCVAAGALPVVLMRVLLPGAPIFGVITIWIWACFWWAMMAFFTCVFGAMAYSDMTRWGRARVWVTRRRIAAVQLRGEESWVAHVWMERVKGFSTIIDGDDRSNPATPGRLVVDMNNNVSRLAAGYPLELLEAMRKDLDVRVREMRGRS